MIIQASDDCKTETGVDDDVLSKAFRGEFSEDDKLKEQAICMGKKVGFLNEDEEIQRDVIKAVVSKDIENIDDFMEECVVDKDDMKESAIGFVECAWGYLHPDHRK